MASLQAVAARPVACRAQPAGIRHAQGPRVRPALRKLVLARVDPKASVAAAGGFRLHCLGLVLSAHKLYNHAARIRSLAGPCQGTSV